MKNTKKLALKKQTIVPLSTVALEGVGGGSLQPNGFIMKDTIIIRTGGFAGGGDPVSAYCP